MALALEKTIAPLTGVPVHSFTAESESKLDIAVVFTSVDGTLAALKEAGHLASSLGGRITLVVPQIVPYPLPLSSPPVLLDFNERRLRVIASNCRVETRVCIYLCREAFETLSAVLKPHSLVVLGSAKSAARTTKSVGNCPVPRSVLRGFIGSRKRWWPTPEERLAAKLRRLGHRVVVTERE
jgi:hypothetical protein